jgi:subtilisin family serine protease
LETGRALKNLIIAFILLPIAVSSLALMPQVHAAENAPLSLLRSHPKLLSPESVFEPLDRGEELTPVIITLREGVSGIRFKGSLQEKTARENRRLRIQERINAFIQGLDRDRIRIKRRYLYMPAFSASVSVEGLEALTLLEDVEAIEPDRILHAHTGQGIPLMNAPLVRGAHGGAGVAVAVCDTGIDYTHSKLGGGGFPNSKVIGGYDFGSNDADPMDQNGHGTACAGIAAGDLGATGDYIGGVAPNARLYALKISYGSSGSAFLSDIIAAWEWCVTHKDDDPNNPLMVISMSFGGGGFTGPCDLIAPSMTSAAANANAAGITLFVSSGNDGFCNKISWPACISHVISVGAVFDADIGGWGWCVDEDSCAPNKESYPACPSGYIAWAFTTEADQVTPYSNVADFLDLFAPSHFAYTTKMGGGYETDFGGTSAACPYAAGLAACVQGAANEANGAFLTPAQVKAKIISHGDPVTYSAAGITKPRPNLDVMDIDDDGMPAEWEIVHFGDILTTDGTGDADEEGLLDLAEFEEGTDPNKPDTDEDGYTDYEEVTQGTDPLDPGSHPEPAPVPAVAGLLPVIILPAAMLLLAVVNKKTNSTLHSRCHSGQPLRKQGATRNPAIMDSRLRGNDKKNHLDCKME